MSRVVMQQALDALVIGLEALQDAAINYHCGMAGHYPGEHAKKDAEVKMASDAIDALRAELDRPCRCGPDGCADSTCPGRKGGAA